MRPPECVDLKKSSDKVARGEITDEEIISLPSSHTQAIVSIKRHNMVTVRKTLVEWNCQAVTISFRAWFPLCFRNGDKSNQYSAIYFWKQFLQWNFPTGPLQLEAVSSMRYTSTGIFWALRHAWGWGVMQTESVYKDFVRWSISCPLWPQSGPRVVKVVFSGWLQQNHQKGLISVQNHLILC